MGYDASFHPVDLPLIQSRLLPYIAGRGEIDDLVEQAAFRARIRFRANAWGLGANGRPDIQSFLHVWGRPFFITQGDPSVGVDRWMAVSSVEAADALGREMSGPAGEMKLSGRLPEDPQLAQGLRWKLDILRSCQAALSAGRDVVEMPDGTTANPASLMSTSLAFAVLEFSANFRPGWMARGFWPSQIFAKEFSPHSPLLGEFPARFPDLAFPAASSLSANYSVGGWLEPEKVAWMRDRIEQLKAPILEQTGVDATSLDKLLEALADAERRGLPFCEASEIYSPMSGIMN